jgi:hypothetical protein
MPQIDDRIAAFAASLNDEIRSQAEQGNPYSVESDCFAHKVLEMLGDAGTLEDPEVCVREGQLGGTKWAIAGWASPSSDDEDLSELSLLAILHHDSPDILPVDASDLRRRFELARNFLKAMLAGWWRTWRGRRQVHDPILAILAAAGLRPLRYRLVRLLY